MPTIKIYPPERLPDKNLSETQFNIWREELEVYLSQEKSYKIFLPGQQYAEWESAESFSNRIRRLNDGDVIQANRDLNAQQAEIENEEKLADMRINLRTVLAIIGKCVSEGHYNSIVRHSTSLTWIYETLKADYNIQSKGIHFFNVLDLKYDADKYTPVAYYNQYRSLIINNLAKAGDTIKYKNNENLRHDEKMSPMLEDMVLLNVIREIDPRLPNFIRSHYNHKMKTDERLMDFKVDILVNILSFVDEIDGREMDSGKEASLNAIKRAPYRKFKKPIAQQQSYCRLCWLAKLPKEIYNSHNIGDDKCTQLSYQDKKKLKDTFKLNILQAEQEVSNAENDMLSQFGYTTVTDNYANEEVTLENMAVQNNSLFDRIDGYTCNFIKPVPSQLLTVYADIGNKIPLHIELDSGASINYCEESAAIKYGFHISINKQTSILGDGITVIESVGEINEVFYRNNWKIIFKAAVCKKLTAPFIGGTLFMKDNGIEQDFTNNVIKLFNRRVTVLPTDPLSILPMSPLSTESQQVNRPKQAKMLTFSHKWLLPDQSIDVHVLNAMQNESILAVQPDEFNNNSNWPHPEFKLVQNGKISLNNSTEHPINIGKEVKRCKLYTIEQPQSQDAHYYQYQTQLNSLKLDDDVNIPTQHIKCPQAKQIIISAHETYKKTFNKDLSKGYNNFYGKHVCNLNWASKERPTASKVQVPNYDHDLKVLQQEVMDELTDQNVLMVPQEHNIDVQSVCPSFLQRKQRAKGKPKSQLTKNDVRLLINFGPVNEKIKPIPNHVPKINDVFLTLGRWKHLICMDLHNGYFQMKMREEAVPWLGIQTPFGGMRVITRAGQGLMGMAEEFEELTSKILKEEMAEGITAKIVDDIYVGGQTQKEAAVNYTRVLAKFHNANIKVSPNKTSIFPASVDVLGWVWKEGGTIEPSPHRKLALENTHKDDIKTIKDMRSWIGLYKTLHIATPRLAVILAPLEDAIKGMESKDPFQWTFLLEQAFKVAKQKLNNLATLYLPAPQDQLLLEVDAAKGDQSNPQAGIGHVLYAIKDGVKKIVRLHSAKLDQKCHKWHPCELEALAFATGIEKEQDIIRESKHPLIIMPDSKPVHEAVNLINQGKFSTSARMASFLNNVNRFKIQSKHISGKANLNPLADKQSRAPASCSVELCSIHKFINNKINGNLDDESQLCQITVKNSFMTNRQAWRKAQTANQACNVAVKLLTSGKPPPKACGKKVGEYWNDVRRYCRDASVARDGTLIVQTPPSIGSGNIERERIVVPKPLAAALLYHMHNQDNHPAKAQQKAAFSRNFYTIALDSQLNLLYDNCYKCALTQNIPKEIISDETKTDAQYPHIQFHADVIRRAKQIILTIKDHFSSFQDAMLLNSEKAEDLKNGIVALVSPLRKPAPICVTVDNSPGFMSLISNSDKDLLMLMIKLCKKKMK